MNPTLFDRVRSSTAATARVATHVRIDEDAIQRLADHLEIDTAPDPADRLPAGDPASVAAFVITLDAVNFGSGFFPHLRKRPGHSGYRTIAASMRDWVDEAGPITTRSLAANSIADWAAVFGQRLDGSPAHDLMVLFTAALRDLAAFVDDRADGDFLGLVEEARGSAAALAEALTVMPFYRDQHEHPVAGTVSLFKRAQITAHDLAIAFGGRGPGRFDDLSQLTMFADNLVPHVLRMEGVLVFEDALVERIESVDDIASGSLEEIEIRACGVRAVELLRDAVRSRRLKPRPTISAADLDKLLWQRGGRPRYKAHPRHRSRSVFY